MFNAPMPHELYGRAGKQVKVHRARLHGYVAGGNGNAAEVQRLKDNVQACLAGHRSGDKLNPPAQWPDHQFPMRTDSYVAANRKISYSKTIAFIVDMTDCHVMDEISSSAELVSAKGTCHIDLDKKYASGVCDANGHADAPREFPHGPLPSMPPKTGGVGNEAAMTLAHSFAQKTGERKVILGIACDVWDNKLMSATHCLATGGSFKNVTSEHNYGVMLESISSVALNFEAKDALLDTLVSEAVFTPYLADGFTVVQKGGRK